MLLPAHTPEPPAGDGEVVVAVEIANVTFVDTQIRAGRPPHPSMLPQLPAILGNGVGGLVAEVGSGVDAALTGRRVVAGLNGRGAHAERAVAAARRLVDVPLQDAEARDVAVLRGAASSPETLVELTRSALAEGAAGRLRPVVGQELALEDAAAAHVAIEARATLGKTLLVVSGAAQPR